MEGLEFTPTNLKFMPLMNSAVIMACQGEWRKAADAYRRTYLVTTTGYSNNFHPAYYCFDGYTSIFREQHIRPSSEDINFLKEMEKDEARPVLHRVHAAFSRGLLHWDSGERQKAAQRYQSAIKIASAVISEEERNRLVYNGNFGYQRMQVVLDGLMEKVHFNLCTLQGVEPSTQLSADASCQIYQVLIGPNFPADEHDRNKYMQAISRRMLQPPVSVSECHQCGSINTLKNCSKCRQAWYCSALCQRAGWKSGHRERCRARYEFQQGDLVRLEGLLGLPAMNGQCVQVAECLQPLTASKKEQRYSVSIIGGDRKMSIKAERMILIMTNSEREELFALSEKRHQNELKPSSKT